jgi:hypothetical protein
VADASTPAFRSVPDRRGGSRVGVSRVKVRHGAARAEHTDGGALEKQYAAPRRVRKDHATTTDGTWRRGLF